MKLAKLAPASLLAVAVALSFAAVGCHKGLDKTTHIPIGQMRPPGDDSARPPRSGDPGLSPGGFTTPGNIGSTPTPPITSAPVRIPEPIAATTADTSNMDENREEFRAQTVYFDFDKANIKVKEVPKLEEVARRMKSNFPGKYLRLEGHCDERGTEEYNRALGDRRAQSAREKLVQLGMDAEKIETRTFGEEKPADPGHNEAAWAKNRRVEILLLVPK